MTVSPPRKPQSKRGANDRGSHAHAATEEEEAEEEEEETPANEEFQFLPQ